MHGGLPSLRKRQDRDSGSKGSLVRQHSETTSVKENKKQRQNEILTEESGDGEDIEDMEDTQEEMDNYETPTGKRTPSDLDEEL